MLLYGSRRFFRTDFFRERVAGAPFFLFPDASAFFFCRGFPRFLSRDVLTGEVAGVEGFFGLTAAFLPAPGLGGLGGFDFGAASSDSISMPKTSARFSPDNATEMSAVDGALAVTLSVAAVMSSR